MSRLPLQAVQQESSTQYIYMEKNHLVHNLKKSERSPKDSWKGLLRYFTMMVSQSVLFEPSAFLLQVSPIGSLQNKMYRVENNYFLNIKNRD